MLDGSLEGPRWARARLGSVLASDWASFTLPLGLGGEPPNAYLFEHLSKNARKGGDSLFTLQGRHRRAQARNDHSRMHRLAKVTFSLGESVHRNLN